MHSVILEMVLKMCKELQPEAKGPKSNASAHYNGISKAMIKHSTTNF